MGWSIFRKRLNEAMSEHVTAEPTRKYIGRVHGFTTITPLNGPAYDMDGWWLLIEENAEREAILIGDPGNSPLAVNSRAEVQIWLLGGPLPALGSRRPSTPSPKQKPRTRKPHSKKAAA